VLCSKDSHTTDAVYTARPGRSEQPLSPGQDVIKRILTVRRRISEVLADLIDVLLLALFDLLAEQVLERPIAKTFVATLREVCDEVRDERAR